MRTIDADALLKKIEEDADFYLVGDDENSKAVGGALLGVKEQINTMPTIESPKMRARWILVDGYRCSICNYKLQTTGLTAYCPRCGAEMRWIG